MKIFRLRRAITPVHLNSPQWYIPQAPRWSSEMEHVRIELSTCSRDSLSQCPSPPNIVRRLQPDQNCGRTIFSPPQAKIFGVVQGSRGQICEISVTWDTQLLGTNPEFWEPISYLGRPKWVHEHCTCLRTREGVLGSQACCKLYKNQKISSSTMSCP